MLDFIRIACAVPNVSVGDSEYNARQICRWIIEADKKGADVVLFPEMALTGYNCADLFLQDSLWLGVKKGLRQIAMCSGEHPNITIVVGLPIRTGNKLYNCAALIARGEVSGLAPKCHLTKVERRWFSPGLELGVRWLEPEDIGLVSSEDYYTIPLSANQLFCLGDDVMAGIEICEDGMVPQPRSAVLAVNGAEVILNLSASHELIGKREYRRSLIAHQSRACNCVYAFVSSGAGDSSADLVYSGHSIIAQEGEIFAENREYILQEGMILTDCDIGCIRADRIRGQNHGHTPEQWLITYPYGDHLRADGALYPFRKYPFVPNSENQRHSLCLEAFQILSAGLQKRLGAIETKAVVGVSGSMNSTLALMVAVDAVKKLGRPASCVHGVTMQSFGATDRTYRYTCALMKKLGVTIIDIPISDEVKLQLRDISRTPNAAEITCENAKARELTQVLLDYAGKHSGVVVGTDDMSELALGWCTYNVDQMCVYGVNSSIPKTLVPCVIKAASELPEFLAANNILSDVLDTPISLDLLPPEADGGTALQTEQIADPYALYDFFLYYMLRYGFAPDKIFALACGAFSDEYDKETIKCWMKTFYKRYFRQRFERIFVPDGVRVGNIALSLRGDGQIPSNAVASLWLSEIEML